MKRITGLLIFTILMCVNIGILKADCESDKEQIEKLAIVDGNRIESDKFVLGFDLYGGNKDLYIKVYNDYNNQEDILKFENGSLTYKLYYQDKKVNVNVKVYSNSCGEQVLMETDLHGGLLNKYSQLDVCKEIIGGSTLCMETIETPNMSEEEFIEQVSKDMKTMKTKLIFSRGFRKYYLYAVIPFFIVAVGFIVAIRIVKIKRKGEFKRGGGK